MTEAGGRHFTVTGVTARVLSSPLLASALSLATLAGCRACDRGVPRADVEGGSIVEAGARLDASAREGAGAEAAPTEGSSADGDAGPGAGDAGAPAGLADGGAACRLVYGPAEQPFRGPAALVTTPTELRLVANDGGRPRIYPIPIAAPPPASAPPVAPARPASFLGMRWPPCEIAGRWAYCQAPGGTINRTTLGASDTKAVAKSRSGTRIAASSLGPDHAVVAALEVRRTTEGDMLQAFATLDEGETVRLSEEGAGATAVRLVPRGDHAVAVYLDARTAMVPVHARPMSFTQAGLDLGSDAVLFVGGPPERGIDFAVAGGNASLFVLVPMPRETMDFGMAAIRVDAPPKDDVAAVWSPYPNGLDPAPIAATTPGTGEAWVARVRPKEAMAGALRVLELGRLEPSGAFVSWGVVVENKPIADVALATDAYGAVWLLYGDTAGTWLERRVCK